MLKNESLFSVNNVLQAIMDLPKYCKVMEYLCVSDNILAKAECHNPSINLVKWYSNTEIEKFCYDVKEFKMTSEENPFSEIFYVQNEL